MLLLTHTNGTHAPDKARFLHLLAIRRCLSFTVRRRDVSPCGKEHSRLATNVEFSARRFTARQAGASGSAWLLALSWL
jgi:hypothetical protein